MHIEKIIISGFRSFRNGTIDNLSPGQNVIIGPNGSGKSSVVTALEFLLTHNFARLNEKQKQEFMCNIKRNVNERITTASVTVVLNNAGERLPLKDPKISIKREINATSDKYYINDRLASYNDILTLMESGGFSPNNSHFLVRQGFVSEVAFGSSKDLLNTLRGISGAASFDEKKEKSLKLITESEKTIQNLESKISSIKEQFNLLNLDREKVKRFQDITKIHRYLNAKLSSVDLERVEQLINELQINKADLVSTYNDETENLNSANKRLKDLRQIENDKSKTISDISNKIKSHLILITDLQDQLNVLTTDIDVIENYSQREDELKKCEEKLKSASELLEDLIMELFQLENEEKQVNGEIEITKQKLKNLYDLLNINKKSATQMVKDAAIQGRLNILLGYLEKYKDLKQDYTGQLSDLKSKRSQNLTFIENNTEESIKNDIISKKYQIDDFRLKINDIDLEKRKYLNEINNLEKSLVELDSDPKNSKLEGKLNIFTADMAIKSKKSILQVLEHCRTRLSNDKNLSYGERRRLQLIIDGYFGQFVDCVELTQRAKEGSVFKAIEVLLKNKIFYHLVANDCVAVEILREVKSLGLNGNFEFVALNRLSTERSNRSSVPEAEPLFSLFNCTNDRARLGVESLCRDVYICQTFELCHQLHSQNYFGDFATLDGDMWNRSGLATFASSKGQTKYDLYLQWAELSVKKARMTEDLNQLKADYLLQTNQLDSTSKNIINLRDEVAQLEHLLEDRPNLILRTYHFDRELERTKQKLSSVESKISCLIEERNFWTEHLGSTIESQFDSNQQSQLEKWTRSITEKRLQNSKLEKDRNLKSLEIKIKQNEISELEKRKSHLLLQQLMKSTSNSSIEKLKRQFEDRQNQCEALKENNGQMNSKLKKLTAEHYEAQSKVEKLEAELRLKRRLVDEKQKEINANNEELEKMNGSLTNLRLDVEKYGSIVSRVSSRNDGIPQRYININNCDQLNVALRDINKELNKITQGRLNEETVRKYFEMQQTLENMERLKDRYVVNANSIRELIDTIEAKKQEIIMRTYKQVNICFQQIFQELVPQGGVRLQFIRNNNATTNRTRNVNNSNIFRASTSMNGNIESSSSVYDASTCSSENRSIRTTSSTISSLPLSNKLTPIAMGDNFNGLEIKVSFTDRKHLVDVSALSGGQKALVSLAFIFAIQKVDPTPFYIFDEVDCSLDETYRVAIAELIQRIATTESDRKQFIITSFRPQLCEYGDKFFKVTNRRGLSSVNEIDKQEALHFITNHRDQDNDATAMEQFKPTSPQPSSQISSQASQISPEI